VIPVINEVGGSGGNGSSQQRDSRGPRPASDAPVGGNTYRIETPVTKEFPPAQVPDTEATDPRAKSDARGY
jgi:hypothetical protein